MFFWYWLTWVDLDKGPLNGLLLLFIYFVPINRLFLAIPPIMADILVHRPALASRAQTSVAPQQ